MFRGMRVLSRILILTVLCFCNLPAFAETLTQNFPHNLGIGTSAQSWEHRIDLPENLAAQGLYFTKRNLALTGKLVIEREELTKTYYYVKVRLPKAWISSVKGNLAVTLEALNQAPVEDIPEAPNALAVREPALNPSFSWAGQGSFAAVSVLDRGNSKTVWERVICGADRCNLDEGGLTVGHHYTWAVKKSDATARYSQETQDHFRIGTKPEYCMSCNGSGWVRCGACNGSGWVIVNSGPNGTPVSQPCSWCHGSGRTQCTICFGSGTVERPIIIHE